MRQTKIKHIEAGEMLDSRGEPTVIAIVTLSSGAKAAAAVPSGASTGAFEAHELRDGNPNRYGGKGVLKACSNVNVKIAQALYGEDAEDQEAIDAAMIELDGTRDKSRLGANAILSVSLACARAVSVFRKIPLHKSLKETFGLGEPVNMPVPIMNLVNGGKHASTNIKLQEFQIIPLMGESVAEKIESGSEIFHSLSKALKSRGLDVDVGDEGGYAPEVESIDDVFKILSESVQEAGFVLSEEVKLGIDAAANSFYDARKKVYEIGPPQRRLEAQELLVQYEEWINEYDILCIEDPFEEEAWGDWSKFCSKLEHLGIIVIGDDLLVTNKKRLRQAINKKSANAILIKPNQIGTLTETIETIKLAQDNNVKVVVSHRSGETNDAFISDLSVAAGADFIKAGAPSRGERVAKYNRLIEIEREL